MRTLVEKSQFLHLAFQALLKDAADGDRLAKVEAEVQRL
jgi:hypothetical protein